MLRWIRFRFRFLGALAGSKHTLLVCHTTVPQVDDAARVKLQCCDSLIFECRVCCACLDQHASRGP